MRHPFAELVPVVIHSHTWYEIRQGLAGVAIVGDPRIALSCHQKGMVWFTVQQYHPWTYNGFEFQRQWRAVPAPAEDTHKYETRFPVEIFKNEDGTWMTFRDVNGYWRELWHEPIYDSYAQASAAVTEDFHSGALESKMQITSTTLMTKPTKLMQRALAIFEGRVVAN